MRLKLIDDTPLHNNDTRDLYKQFNKYWKLCEREQLDFEKYVDSRELAILVEQLKCCLRNREKLKKC